MKSFNILIIFGLIFISKFVNAQNITQNPTSCNITEPNFGCQEGEFCITHENICVVDEYNVFIYTKLDYNSENNTATMSLNNEDINFNCTNHLTSILCSNDEYSIISPIIDLYNKYFIAFAQFMSYDESKTYTVDLENEIVTLYNIRRSEIHLNFVSLLLKSQKLYYEYTINGNSEIAENAFLEEIQNLVSNYTDKENIALNDLLDEFKLNNTNLLLDLDSKIEDLEDLEEEKNTIQDKLNELTSNHTTLNELSEEQKLEILKLSKQLSMVNETKLIEDLEQIQILIEKNADLDDVNDLIKSIQTNINNHVTEKHEESHKKVDWVAVSVTIGCTVFGIILLIVLTVKCKDCCNAAGRMKNNLKTKFNTFRGKKRTRGLNNCDCGSKRCYECEKARFIHQN